MRRKAIRNEGKGENVAGYSQSGAFCDATEQISAWRSNLGQKRRGIMMPAYGQEQVGGIRRCGFIDII